MWSDREKAFCVEVYIRTGSHKTVVAEYRKKFGLDRRRGIVPSKNARFKWVEKKCTVWCAFNESHGVIGPYWFESTVDSHRYLEVALKPFWRALGRKRGLDRDEQWFQQDGATAHTSQETREWLGEHFGQQIVSWKTPIIWSPHSPDLSPLDFFLWGYLKDRVYREKPATIADLKEAIEAEVADIPLEMCQRVGANFWRRIELIQQRNGDHIEHVLTHARRAEE